MSQKQEGRSTRTKRPERRKRQRTAIGLSILMVAMLVLQLVSGLVRSRPRQAAAPRGGTLAPAAVITDPERAQAALEHFFSLLNQGRYAEATAYYGGSYDSLAARHPEDAADHAALLRDACTVDGFQCLPVKSVKTAETSQAGAFLFGVAFARPDGSLLVADAQDAAAPPFFEYTVINDNGHYLVQGLPVLQP